MSVPIVVLSRIVPKRPGDPILGNVQLPPECGGAFFPSVERPWANNEHGVSCILPAPGGSPIDYAVEMRDSPKHGRVYGLMDVEGRSDVEMHSANVYFQLLGCIALGLQHEAFSAGSIGPGMPPVDTVGVSASKAAMTRFVESLGGKPFKLRIQWALPKEDA